MKKKKGSLKKLAAMPAAASVLAMAASAAHGQAFESSYLFSADFPASWNGTSTTVTSVGPPGLLGGSGFQSGTATYTTSTVPSGAAAGTGSMALSGVGGIKVTPTDALNNGSIAYGGGFAFNIDFLWNGGFSSSFGGTQKLIDYAGTESLQLIAKNATSATLEMQFANNTGVETTALTYTINPNTWYNTSMVFNTYGAALNADGSITGTASLYLNGVLVAGGAGYGIATKGTYGDGLNRPIGIGEFGYGHTTSIIGLDGDIYSASIQVVPEPSTLALGALGGLGLLGLRWRFRRGNSGA
ncbi:MAG TPA: PEP-CTERM sorting domain-containing protein [Verrucomicrobiae bacterium]|nr:PEP-CTERM sorting domain-containing protein [Verrucomicrobiae bacterium]